jgi:hypothetical protein
LIRVAAAAALLAVPLGAQTLDEILARNLQARGGYERLKAMQTVRLRGTMSLGAGMQAPFTLELKRPDKMRSEFTLDGETGVQAFDGATAWTLMPFAGRDRAEPLPPEEAQRVAEQADFDGPLVDWKAKGHRLELAGTASVDGAPAWKLTLTLKSGEQRTVYLDAKTSLEVRSEGVRQFQGNRVEFTSSMSDYREVDGLQVPFLIETGPKDAPQRQRLLFQTIEYGVPIDDARFQLPAGAPTRER